ncbi:MAG: ABC transporter ATP-binding protein [Verrucomicrobiales bacterium]|nr:ABC transporter ATP-binding protein [Verrucomicrobiales bacterium]
MRVQLRRVSKVFGATRVLRDITFEVADRELFFLLGPSGCGKTTLLRLIAGFYQPDDGELHFGDRRMNGVEPHRRNTGMVFQNYALWPHLSVSQNVAYGLEVRSVPAGELRQRVDEALRTVRMEAYADRAPNQLSGGQQQRVALARALVVRPDVLLLDEPLSNLDARLRLEMRDEIRRIHDETRITTIYVTHDQKEALSMADRMAVLRDGVIEQIGPPRTVYRQPANRFVADFIGEANWLDGVIREIREDGMAIETRSGLWHAAMVPEGAVVGTPVEFGFRPEAVRLGSSGRNAWVATAESVTYLGETEQTLFRFPDGSRFKAFEQDPVEVRLVGSTADVHVLPSSLFVFPKR